jgi:hypothetical protein
MLGPLIVTELVSTLVGLRFPTDLSGGVARFRHRRGSLDALAVQLPLHKLAQYFTPRIRQNLNAPHLRIDLLPTAHGFVVGLHEGDWALAFSCLFAPEDREVQWVVTDARAVGLDQHAHGAALRAADALLGHLATRHGSLLRMDRAMAKILREILIDAGARVPQTADSCICSWQETTDGIRVEARAGHAPLLAPPHVLRAVQLARIAQYADDALARGDHSGAREAYLLALEAAPRHPDLVLRVAELDMIERNSPESALAFVVEALPAVDGGLVAAMLLHDAGETQAAAEAARRAAEREPFGPLAALLLCVAAGFTESTTQRLALFDEAAARAPAGHGVRSRRARAYLEAGQSEPAVADLGHLEAAARGAARKFEVCMQAGRLFLDARIPHHAKRFFERGLRYMPRSADASAGLARAFLQMGEGARGAALLARAVSLASAQPEPQPTLQLELASCLAEHASDLPSAIAHARSVPFGTIETVAARALEGRWRAQLGDSVGASVAFHHAREAFAVLQPSVAARVATWLLEASRFELEVVGNPQAALRHAEAALRAMPRDSNAESLFRQAAAELAARLSPPATPLAASADEPASPQTSLGTTSAPHEPATCPPQAPDPEPPGLPQAPSLAQRLSLDEATADDAQVDSQLDALITQLTGRVQADPSDSRAVSQLCDALNEAKRHMDLFALVSARLEESHDLDECATLRQHRLLALQSLIAQARNNGRHDEAEVYELALADFDGDSS